MIISGRGKKKDEEGAGIWSATSLKLHFFALVILSWCNQRLLQIFWAHVCFWSATNTKLYNILWLIVDEETEMVDLLFKWVLWFFICSKRGLLILFQDCLNVVIMWNLKLILLYYLAHTPSILILSHFWWSVTVFSMVYIWGNPAVVSSENHIHLVTILSHLSISLPSRRCLMRSAHSLSQNFLCRWGQGQYQPRGRIPPPTTLVMSLGYVAECTGSWIQWSPICSYQVYPTSWCWKTNS